MKVALYARVSTSDRDQDPETQLMALRDFVKAQGWEILPGVRRPGPGQRHRPPDRLAAAAG